MANIHIVTKTNGYKAERIQPMIGAFEAAAEKLFPGCTVRHFYYGEALDMISMIIDGRNYAHFGITANRVSLTGYTLSNEQLKLCESMTYNDELYDGKLLEIAKGEA